MPASARLPMLWFEPKRFCRRAMSKIIVAVNADSDEVRTVKA